MTETSILDFNQHLWIPEIHKLVLHLPQVKILGHHHCGNTHQESLKHRSDYQYLLCHRGYSELVVASSAHQIQYEYYGGNAHIEVILL